MKVTELRKNIYNILDEILETGEPIEIQRKGRVLKIIPDKKISKLDRLKKRKSIIGDDEDIIYLDWSEHWNEKQKL